ncbi:MAG: LysM domain-containing protein [Thermoleophilia bacterium]
MRQPRRGLARYAAPVAFLLAATIAVLLIRSALDESGPAAGTTSVATTQPTTTATTTTATTTTPTTTTTGAAEFHTIVSGDTFQQLALDNHTSVDELVRLNPGVNPSALTVGQKIRIR